LFIGYSPSSSSSIYPAMISCSTIYFFRSTWSKDSPALMRAIVLTSLFLRIFIQLQLWHGEMFGIVRHERIVMQVCSRGNNSIRSSYTLPAAFIFLSPNPGLFCNLFGDWHHRTQSVESWQEPVGLFARPSRAQLRDSQCRKR